jgi:hypothetical protein
MWPASVSWPDFQFQLPVRCTRIWRKRERSHLAHEYREREREAGPPHERTSMELTSCMRRRERRLLERMKMEKEREAQIL